ncbi:MAG: hypothetical protein AAB512_03740 [Patescibacteria group bacterium]
MLVQPKANLFYIAIFAPNYKNKLSYGGYVKSLSCVNEKGPFDLLPMHENFATVVLGNVIIVDEFDKRVEIPLQKAVLDVSNNVAKLFVDY